MAEYKRIALLIGVMMAVVIAATATSISVDYRTAFERERQHLIANVGSHARIMEAMARFEAATNRSAPEQLGSSALRQIADAHTHQEATGDTAELTIGEPFPDRWAFDVELLGRLMARGATVFEEPLSVWRDIGGSKLRARSALRAGLDLVHIAWDLRRRR